MPNWIISILIALVPSLIVGIVTAIVSVKLSLRRYHAERWWERKADTYSKLIESLHHMKIYCDTIVNEEAGYKYDKDHKKRIEQEYEIGRKELVKTTHVGAFIICEEAAKVLEDLHKRPELDFHNDPVFEIFASESAYFDKALKEIRVIAKKDLGVK